MDSELDPRTTRTLNDIYIDAHEERLDLHAIRMNALEQRIAALEAANAALLRERNEYRAANYNMIEDIRALRARLDGT